MNAIHLKDRFSFKDDIGMITNSINDNIQGGLWARTEVIGGYGDFINNPNGKSSLGEVLFRTHNIVPIGGVSYVLQRMFETPETQIEIPTMYDENGIGIQNSNPPSGTSESFPLPDGTSKTVQYRQGHYVSMFGVGITSTAENDISIYKPDYREYSINMTKVTPDGLTVTGVMLPFRFTSDSLTNAERKKYFGKKVDTESGATGYYYKTFEQNPVIKHIWKTGEDAEEEVLVPSSEIWTNQSGLNAVESFVEIFLKIGKLDIKEWFTNIEQRDRTRINTIALFTGQYVRPSNGATDNGDFRDVRLFSKLCINPEYLNLNKDLNIIYRIYGA